MVFVVRTTRVQTKRTRLGVNGRSLSKKSKNFFVPMKSKDAGIFKEKRIDVV